MAGNFYGNGLYTNNNPYYNPQHQMNSLVNQYPQYFNQQVQQNLPSQISTQPPIMQPQNTNINTNANRNIAKIIYVGNKEEATATPVDLTYNIPTFFYNRGTNEIYLKQYDSTNGNSIFKIYGEIQPTEQQITATKSQADINYPNDELKAINERLDVIYRILMTPSPSQYPFVKNIEKEKEKEEEDIDVEEHKSKGKRNA